MNIAAVLESNPTRKVTSMDLDMVSNFDKIGLSNGKTDEIFEFRNKKKITNEKLIIISVNLVLNYRHTRMHRNT